MFIIRHNRIILGLILLCMIISFVFIPNLKVKYDLQSFFVEGNSDVDFYNDFRTNFDSEDNMLMIAIHSKKGIYNHNLLRKINDFTNKCKLLPHVNETSSITTIKDMVKTPLGLISFPLLHFEDSLRYQSDSSRISRDRRINGWYISNDALSATIMVEVCKNLDEESKDKLITELDKFIEESSFPEVHIAGTLNYETRYYRMISKEIQFNILICAVVIVLSLILIFRTLSGVLIPAITVIITMILFYGLLGVLDKSLNVLSTLFPTIILVVGTSNLIHILSKYKDLLAKGEQKKLAIIETFKELRITIFLTSLTTAIGFFSLTISSMKPFRDFGFEAGIGVLIAFIIAITFVPSVLYNMKAISIKKKRKSSLTVWTRITENIFFLVNKFPKRIILITIIILLVSVIGIFRINTNNYILSNFSSNSPIKQDFHFFEENLSGVRIFEMAIQVKEGDSITNIEVLKEVDKMHSYFGKNPDFGAIYSPVTIYKSINQIYEGGISSAFKLPASQSTINKYDKEALRINRKLYFQFIDSTKTKGRITARMKDIGTSEIKRLNKETEHWISNNIESNIVEFRNTGVALLADKSNDYLSRNMILSLAIAFIIVSIIMFLLFKDFNMVFISLIPNIFPLLIVAAIMGFTGIVLNGPISIIFTIGFVIAVDDTIHFLSKFKLELNKDQNIKDAIRTTLRETGKAIIITTIILFFGFIVLLHSDIKEVFYQGLLVGIMLVTALVADLFLLPVLLVYFLKKKNFSGF